jgi:hypothetical protein
VNPKLFAGFVRRVLRHPALNSKAKRMGLVVRAEPLRLIIWRLHQAKEIHLSWK